MYIYIYIFFFFFKKAACFELNFSLQSSLSWYVQLVILTIFTLSLTEKPGQKQCYCVDPDQVLQNATHSSSKF